MAETVLFFEGIREENPLEKVPEGWIVYNAPRPLMGHEGWSGEFVHGIFYAAVNQEGEYADVYIKRNQELDGHIVKWVAKGDVLEWARRKLEDYGIREEFDCADYDDYYVMMYSAAFFNGEIDVT